MCVKHPTATGTVCGTFVCGFCYMDDLMTTSVPKAPPPADYFPVKDKYGHVKMMLMPVVKRAGFYGGL